jgi:MinD superfamily P-loop ATPase
MSWKMKMTNGAHLVVDGAAGFGCQIWREKRADN